MLRLSLIALLTIVGICVPATVTTYARARANPFAALRGAEIACEIARAHAPRTVIADTEIRPTLFAIDMPDGSGKCPFTGEDIKSENEFSVARIVPAKWWQPSGHFFANDLHTLRAATAGIASLIENLPPGDVNADGCDINTLCIGIASTPIGETNAYRPPKSCMGDIARALMYAATAYPYDFHDFSGLVILSDSQYPGLSDYGAELLMRYHRADPVDEAERTRMLAVSEVQGNINPFVAYPELAEHLWGDLKDEAVPDTTDPTLPRPDRPKPDETVPLKAVYSISRDGHIDLASPYVRDKSSEWTFDGKAAATRIDLNGVKPGKYEITFSGKSAKGKIIVTVEP